MHFADFEVKYLHGLPPRMKLYTNKGYCNIVHIQLLEGMHVYVMYACIAGYINYTHHCAYYNYARHT